MARKTKNVTIDSGRDAGKQFLITEMPIIQADRWATRTLMALAKASQSSNVSLNAQRLSKINKKGGMLEMAKFAFSALGNIEYDTAQELLDQLMSCVQIIPSSGTPRALVMESDIEDVKTLFLLRKEAFFLHVDFLTEGSSQN